MLIKKQCSYGLKTIFIRTLYTIIISILFTNQVKANFESFTLTQIDSIQLELETASSVDKRLSLLMEAAQILYNQRLYEKSMEFAEEAYNTSKENNYEKSQAQAMLQMARIHRKLNNTNKAFEVAIETKKLADDKGFTLESAEASIILSATLFITGEFEKSAELAFNSLEVLEQNKKFSDLCYAKSLIGLVYNVNDNDSLAVDYLTNAINLGKEHKCYTELGVAIANLAVIYGKKEDYQKAYSFQKQACNILAEHVPNSPAEGMGYCNLAVYLFKSNQPDSAFKYITKALTHSIRINNSRNIAIAHKGIAYYYQHNNDEPNFLKHINLAYKITEQNDYKIPQMEVARTLEEFYVEKGRMDSAYKYQGISAAIEKEFNSQNTLTKLMQLQMMKEFEIAEKAQRIKDQRHKFIAIMSLFAFVSALVILFVLFMRYKLKMRYLNLKQEKL